MEAVSITSRARHKRNTRSGTSQGSCARWHNTVSSIGRFDPWLFLSDEDAAWTDMSFQDYMGMVLDVEELADVVGAPLRDLPVLHLPYPLAVTLVRGLLTKIVCLARWRLPWQCTWPPKTWLEAFSGRDESTEVASLSVERLSEIKAHLKRFAARLPRVSDDGDEDDDRLTLEVDVRYQEAVARGLREQHPARAARS